MTAVAFHEGRMIDNYLEPYFIAEVNTSHFGNIDIAKDMIVKAHEVGCHCVKFQSWTAETLYSAAYYRDNPIAKRMVKKFSFDNTALKELSDYARSIGIDFSSTPYSGEEAQFLTEECGVPFVKIASMELNNLPYLDFLAQLGVPLVLSTGMGTMEEIQKAVEVIRNHSHDKLIILHCTSLYPAEPEYIRLLNIQGLREQFPDVPIGYSDHSLGADIPAAAVALGACVIEKHFTLDSSRIGMDNQMATQPEDMRAVITACKNVHAALGGVERILDEKEKEQALKMRRSLIVRRPLKKDHVLTQDDIDAKRPADGLPPSEIGSVIGRTLKRDYEAEELIVLDDLE